MKKTKKILSIILAVMMILTAVPLTGMTAFAEDTVKYLDANGNMAQADCTAIVPGTLGWSGWMVADGSVTISKTIELADDTNLILADGATLTADSGIIGDKTLTVYAQSTGSKAGKLVVGPKARNNPICITGNLTVHGGIVELNATDNFSYDSSCIYNGSLTVTGGNVSMNIPSCRKAAYGVNTGALEVTGGSVSMNLSGRHAYGVYNGALKVSGGSVSMNLITSGNGAFGVFVDGITGDVVSISGGEVSMEMAAPGSTGNVCGVYSKGNQGDILNVSGGSFSFTGTSNFYAKGVDVDGTNSRCNALVVSGGKVNIEGTQAVECSELADGYYAIKHTGGTVNLFGSWGSVNVDDSKITASKTEVSSDGASYSEWDGETALSSYNYLRFSHVHSFEEKWTTNETAHWHKCTADGCDIEDYATSTVDGVAYGTHTWENGVCTVCGYECDHNGMISGTCEICGAWLFHIHGYTPGDWKYDETSHWYICTQCNQPIMNENHNWVDGKCSVCEYECKHNFVNGKCSVCGYEESVDPEGYSIFVYYDGLSDGTASYGSVSHDIITEPYYVIPENPDTVKEDLNFNGFYCKNTNKMVQIGDSVPLSDFIEKEDGYYLYLSARFSEKEKPGVTYTDINRYYVTVSVQYPDDPYAYLEDSDAGMLTFDGEFEKLDGQNVGTVTQPRQLMLYARMGLNFMGYRSLLTGNVFETGDTVDVDKLPEAVYVGYELQEINETEGYRISLYEVNDYAEPIFEYLGAVGGFLEPIYECTVNYYIPVEPDENEGTTGDPLQFYSFAGSDVHTLAMFDLDMPMELTCQPDYMEDLGYVLDGYGALDDDEITYPDGLIFMDQYSTNDDAGHLTYDVKLFYTEADEDATEEELLASAKEKISAKYQAILDDASTSEGVKTIAEAILADIENAADRNEMKEICRIGEESIKLQEAKDMAIAEVMTIAPEGDITDEMQAVIDNAVAAIQASEDTNDFEDIIAEARSEINRLMREAENPVSGAVQDVQYTSAVGTTNTYQITVEDRANMVQLMELDHGDGTGTRSFDRYHDSVSIVSYDKDGNVVASTSKDVAYEVWTITTKLADGNIGVRVKEAGSPAWEDASNAYVFENTYAPVDSAVISAAPAKTEGGKGAVKATVVTGADAQIVQLKNKEGETFTFDLSKATENEDGTLTFNCAVYFHGTVGTENTATIRVCDVYGWHDSDVTFDYEIIK